MTLDVVLTIANQYRLRNPAANASYMDAAELHSKGHYEQCYRRALDSLRYSVGIFHSDYKRVRACVVVIARSPS